MRARVKLLEWKRLFESEALFVRCIRKENPNTQQHRPLNITVRVGSTNVVLKHPLHTLCTSSHFMFTSPQSTLQTRQTH